jgi:hypothetical protein
MSVTLGTFASTQEKIEQHQAPIVDTPIQTVETPIVADTPIVDTPITDTPIVDTPIVEQEPEIGQSSFSLSMDDEPVIDTPVTQAPSYDWKQEISKLDKKEVLKALEINDFAIELNEHIARGGNAVDYLQAKAVDYNQVSDEALLKEQLQTKYPTFTKEDINKMYNRRYAVSEDALDEDREIVDLQRKADAYELRQAKIQQQQSFKIPEASIPSKDEAYEQWKQHKESETQYVEQLGRFYTEHAATKALHESKRVAIGVGEGVPAFNVNIDRPELITNSFVDGGKTWQKLLSTKTGEPDVQKQQLLTIIAANPDKFIQDIFNYGKQMGVRNIVADGQNATRPKATVVNMATEQKPTYGTGRYGDKQR